MKKYVFIVLLLIAVVNSAFFFTAPDEPVAIPASVQRSGDPAKGYHYLLNGDYVRGGIPEKIFRMGLGNPPVLLERDSINKNIPHDYTAVKAANGETVIAPNCLQCHAQVFDGQLYIGLGNAAADFSDKETMSVKNLDRAEKLLKTLYPKKYKASHEFFNIARITGPLLYTEVRGVNAADRLAAVLVAHRDPVTFKWRDSALMDIPSQLIPSDVPAWWLLKKKNGMFYNGFGRGDFAKFLGASNLLTVTDTAESNEVDRNMPDVLAYIRTLQPPKFPKEINASLAKDGNVLFNNHCSGCHGRYDEVQSYPNLLIPESIIQTDSLLYASNYSSPQFVNWFNQSWFSMGDHPAKLEPYKGYIAPPLDGIWITAPYLHNGSVPTLEALLNSKLRPAFWSRDFDKPQYDYEDVGWIFKTEMQAGGNKIYNTTLPGYSNSGHYFGDKFTDAERTAVIEYLKTL